MDLHLINIIYCIRREHRGKSQRSSDRNVNLSSLRTHRRFQSLHKVPSQTFSLAKTFSKLYLPFLIVSACEVEGTT